MLMLPYKGSKKIFVMVRDRESRDYRHMNSADDYVFPFLLWTFLIWIEDTKPRRSREIEKLVNFPARYSKTNFNNKEGPCEQS